MGDIADRVVQATSDAILASDRDGTIVYWNPAESECSAIRPRTHWGRTSS